MALRNVVLPDTLTSIPDGAFDASGYSGSSTSDYSDAWSTVTIPDSVTEIGYRAFATTPLRELIIPDGVTRIGQNAFSYNSNLIHIHLPAGIDLIDNGVLADCVNLPAVTVPDGVKTIVAYAFYGCLRLKSVSIPAGITEIQANAFLNCYALKDVYFGGDQTAWEKLWEVKDGNDPKAGNETLLNAMIHYNTTVADDEWPEPLPDSEALVCTYGDYSTVLGPTELCSAPSLYNRNLAMLCAMLSHISENEQDRNIRNYLTDAMEIGDEDIFTANYKDSENGDHDNYLAYTIATKEMVIDGEKTNVIFVIARGSVTKGELIQDRFTTALFDITIGGKTYKAYNLVWTFYDQIMKGLNGYVEAHSGLLEGPFKIIVTGHSLGGAAANLVAAKLISEASTAKKQSIYAYTFGAIDSLDENTPGVPISSGYENIHSVYNDLDTFGPNGKLLITAAGNSSQARFGHVDRFTANYKVKSLWDKIQEPLPENRRDTDDFAANHVMPGYLYAVDRFTNFHDTGRVCRLRIACPVDVEIYDGDVLVGAVRDNVIDESVTTVDVVVEEDVKYVVFPADSQYTVKFLATDAGGMTYAVQEMDSRSFESKTFENVRLYDGKAMISEIGGSVDAPEARLYVLNSKELPVKEVMTDGTETFADLDNLEEVEMQVSVSGNTVSYNTTVPPYVYAQLLIGLYDADGRLTSLQAVDVADSPSGTVTVPEAYEYQVFLVDSDTLIPVFDSWCSPD